MQGAAGTFGPAYGVAGGDDDVVRRLQDPVTFTVSKGGSGVAWPLLRRMTTSRQVCASGLAATTASLSYYSRLIGTASRLERLHVPGTIPGHPAPDA
ncbi:hypothetical protein AHiyo4_39850 [Arthrobacter sp. Hiyo4]|nr:hypothetical protein AHiyo4_39850 [Arthrobacter sp. Hiyo4]